MRHTFEFELKLWAQSSISIELFGVREYICKYWFGMKSRSHPLCIDPHVILKFYAFRIFKLLPERIRREQSFAVAVVVPYNGVLF